MERVRGGRWAVMLAPILVVAAGVAQRSHDGDRAVPAGSDAHARGLPGSPLAAGASGLADLRARAVSFMTGSGAPASDRHVAAALDTVRRAGQGAREAMGSDGSWADLRYDDRAGAGSGVVEHVSRLRRMALAHKTPGQSLCGNAELLSAIERSLLYLKRIALLTECVSPYTGCPEFGYSFGLAVPLDLGKTLVLMKGNTSREAYGVGLRAMLSHMRDLSPSSRSNYNVGTIMINAYAAMLTEDDPAMQASRTAIGNVLIPNPFISSTQYSGAEGMKPDYSYLDHGALLYTGGYGDKEFAGNLVEYVFLTAGTRYAVTEAALQHFANYVADGIAWSIHGAYYDPSVMGRTATRRLRVPYGDQAMILMANTPSRRRSEIVSATRKYLDAYAGTYPIEVAGLVSRVQAESEPAAWPRGHKQYPFADFAIHRRPGFYLSIKMLSDRTLTSEAVGNENTLGALLADGRMHLTLRGDEYAGDVLPALDWSRLPGVTVEQKPDVAALKGQPRGNAYGLSSGFGWPGKRSFVGGASDGVNGVAAMDFESAFTSLTARKSWFFFDDYVVFAADGIQDSSGHAVETVIDQRPLLSAAAPMHVNGTTQPTQLGWAAELTGVNWITANDIGYYFPVATRVKARRETRSGSWSRINGRYGRTAVHQVNMFTLWQDHGADVKGAGSLYVVVPNQTDETMPTWVAHAGLRAVRRDRAVTAMEDPEKGLLGIVFWQATGLTGMQSSLCPSLSVSVPSVVMVRRSGAALNVSVADPAHGTGTVRLTFDGTLRKVSADAGVVITYGSGKTHVDVARADPYGGWTRRFSLIAP